MRMTRMIGCIFGLSLVLIGTKTGWTDSALPANDSLVAHLPEGAVANYRPRTLLGKNTACVGRDDELASEPRAR